jgi:cellulose synthase/poly-beta-1,6-N-acetylglucosamine synthase-like glycosyltransferase
LSFVVAAYNEESVITAKLENSLLLDYPPELLEIVVVTDGSDDQTPNLVARFEDRGVRLFHQPERRGKIAAFNRVVPHCNGEILVFSDANAFFQPQTLHKLVRNFADPEVGCVTGAKHVQPPSPDSPSSGEGLYWRYERWLRERDSLVGSVMGAVGEIFSVRRDLYDPPAEDTILDDFVLSMRLVEAGHRVVYEPEAVAWETLPPSLLSQWKRRTRNAAGGFQSVVRLSGMWKLSLTTFQYVSHRVLRWMVAPSMLIVALITNALLAMQPLQDGPSIYHLLLMAQVCFYLAAGLGLLLALLDRSRRWLQPMLYFCVGNAAALVGAYRFARGRQPVTWERTRG